MTKHTTAPTILYAISALLKKQNKTFQILERNGAGRIVLFLHNRAKSLRNSQVNFAEF